ncbi:mitochondrial succinate dehydrogenase cytochrome b560 subunit D [Trematosphaeria pertusa]|uniref:Succinate dehydrogenase [ubiquinone] cytochrome b small subunit n=1 Tax=Trematosphaeria pertusa TaxID=390896 RepID=A0A6A6I8P6_9PLEO|nr:mitochondrial succinate dehydrogenase cytochrome b560 subunit D [Trematosphaeria pertusa]KAF2246736.1 mitochondrial succinate dehydrogenase cytochrome b560 subunit D [Trematosphaeria pertusa]
MASIMRPGLLRQGLQSPAASQRMFSTITSSSIRQTSPLVQKLRPALARSAIPKSTRIAAFHATQRQQILPPLPQKIKGTLNDPTPIPDPAPVHGSYHWSFERLVAVGLVPLTLAPFAAGSLNPVMDSILCALLVVHSHIGFESCIIDYIPKPRIPVARSLAMWALRIGTITLGVALYSFETNDVGITEAVTRLWHA